MCEVKKPELSDLDKKRGNELYRYMFHHGVCTKEELCAVLGWQYNTSNDRRIRELISIVAKRVPVISCSDSKGYRVAKTKDDLAEVEHQWAELSSRCEELEARMQPLIKFRDKFKWGCDNEQGKGN